MTTDLAKMDSDTLLKLATGNTKNLNPTQKIDLIVQVCQIAGLDPRLSPFEFITFQGKEVLYARKNAADQLVNVHKIRVSLVSQVTEDDIRIVTASAVTADGREQQDIGAVNIKGLVGDNRANALMKAVTKAKRRTILSVCGLSMLDESEIETIPGARPAHVQMAQKTPHVTPSPPTLQAGSLPLEGTITASSDLSDEMAQTLKNLDQARAILDAEIVTPEEMELPLQQLPFVDKSDKSVLARKARIDALKKIWGPAFMVKAEHAICDNLPPKLSMLSVEQIEMMEAAAEEKP